MKENANKEYYVLGKFALAAGAITAILFYVFGDEWMQFYPNCYVRERIGLYCPGCGGTRAFMYFLHGHFLQSFFAHPIVLYTAVVYVCFMINMILVGHFHMKIKEMNILPYIYVGIGIILVQWIVKNVCLIGYGFTWI